MVWGNVAAHLWWLEAPVEATTFFGAKLSVDARDICGRYIYYFGIWEPHLTGFIQRRLKPGDTFVDVGANVGYYSLLASTIVGNSGQVVSLEALPSTFEMLRKGIHRSRARNIRPVNVAAWDTEASLPMFSGKDVGTSSLIPEWAERWNNSLRTEVKAATLSSLLTPAEKCNVRLIKIDVEGAELHVVRGMLDLLAASREELEVVVEVMPKFGDEITALFRSHGFHVYQLRNDYSARSYFEREAPDPPRRIESIPAINEQADIVFSRVDAAAL
jgi:FkbM family methyltransferase